MNNQSIWFAIQLLSVLIILGSSSAKPMRGAVRTYTRKPLGAATVSGVTYHKGPLLKNVQVFTVFYGNDTLYQAETNAFYKSVTASPFMDNLSQYSQPGYSIGRGNLSGSIVISNTTKKNPNFSALVVSLVNGGIVPNPNRNHTYIAFHAAPSIDIGGACTLFCAYHSYMKTKFGDIAFGVIPDQESVTDPHPNTGYVDANDDEVGDMSVTIQ
ncbi:hypothetical protein BDR26DRAFT_877386 [Obelidium mucronatum]|nr:hypothetical protein BDR26DRAFT_877386 [Obelidium mucronatum]